MKEKKSIYLSSIPKGYFLNPLGEGIQGNCYLLDDNHVFKYFKYDYPDKEKIERLSELNSNLFMFPQRLVYLDGNLIGYIMPYVEGNNLSNIGGETLMKEFVSSVDNVEKESKSLAETSHLMVCNTHYKNVILDKKSRIKIIDTTDFIFDDYNEDYKIYRHSIKELSNAILYPLFKSINIKDPKLEQYYLDAIIYGKCKSSYVLYEALNKMEKECGSEIKTYDDFEKGLRLIKR